MFDRDNTDNTASTIPTVGIRLMHRLLPHRHRPIEMGSDLADHQTRRTIKDVGYPCRLIAKLLHTPDIRNQFVGSHAITRNSYIRGDTDKASVLGVPLLEPGDWFEHPASPTRIEHAMDTVLYEIRDKIAFVTINRPEAYNACDRPTYERLNLFRLLAVTEDSVEGTRAFAEKRPPEWKAR